MLLGDRGTAFLPEGGALPGGSYPVYSRLELTNEGAVTGEVHFLSEPQYPRPISIGEEFDLHVPHPDSLLGDEVVLRVRFVDNSGSVTGYAHGSEAQFRSPGTHNLQRVEGTPLNQRNVFVIHGRDERIRKGMFTFLQALGLNPLEWAHAVELTKKGTPYVGEVLDAAFSNAQAVVVLFTPDDLAKLRHDLCGAREPAHEANLTPQARPNVLFEAGMAMARNQDRTIMVEIGTLRPFSDVGGRHTIRMDNTTKKRNELATRLRTAGCAVNLNGTDWQTEGDMSAPEVDTATESPPQAENPIGQLPGSTDSSSLLRDLISELEDNLEAARAPRTGDVYARPSNRVWKEQRNRLQLPDHAYGRIVNTYREIDRWHDIVASGLSPKIGSPALEAMTSSLRSTLPELISELKRLATRGKAPALSAESRALLLEACADKIGALTYVEVTEGLIVQANGKQFAETGNRRSEAKWKQAVDDLARLKLIESPSLGHDVLDVTHAGFELADVLRVEGA